MHACVGLRYLLDCMRIALGGTTGWFRWLGKVCCVFWWKQGVMRNCGVVLDWCSLCMHIVHFVFSWNLLFILFYVDCIVVTQLPFSFVTYISMWHCSLANYMLSVAYYVRDGTENRILLLTYIFSLNFVLCKFLIYASTYRFDRTQLCVTQHVFLILACFFCASRNSIVNYIVHITLISSFTI